MHGISRHTKSSRANRIVAAIMGSVMFVVVLFSALYIVSNANHDCIGEHCQSVHVFINVRTISGSSEAEQSRRYFQHC